MAVGNTAPIFSSIAQIEMTNGVLTANAALDGTGTIGTDIYLIFTGAATYGSFFQGLIATPRGANAASVLRVFLNNGLTNATIANNIKIGEITLPASTASAVAALTSFEYVFNRPIPAGWRVLVTLGTTVVGGYAVSGHGGSYVP